MLKKILCIILLSFFSYSIMLGYNETLASEQSKSFPEYKNLETLIKLAKRKQDFPPQKNMKIGKELVAIGKKNNDSKIIILGLQTLGFGYGCVKDLKKSFEMYNKSLQFAENSNLSKAITYSEMSNFSYYYNEENSKKGLAYYKKAINGFRKNKNLYEEAKFKNKTANIFLRLGEYKKAVKLYISVLKDLELLGTIPTEEKFSVLENIAVITCSMGNLRIAEEYMKRYQLLYNKNRNFHFKVKLLYIQSKLSFYKKNYKKSLYLANRSIFLQELLSNNLTIISANRVKMVLLENKLNILLEMNELDKVAKVLKDIEDMINKTPDSFIIANVLILRSIYYYKLKQYDSAIDTGLKSVALCKSHNFNGKLLKAYTILINYSMEYNKPEFSLKFLKEKKLLEKRENNSRLAADIMAIIFNYENNNTLEKLGKANNNILFLIIVSSLLISILSIFTFFVFKNIKKEQQITLDSIKKELKTAKTKSNSNKLSEVKSKILLKAIINTIKEKELFLNPEFSLNMLSNILGINHYYLSSVINSDWGNNFNDLINTFRIEKAKNMLKNPKNLNIKTIDICFEVGFNSSTTFYRVFKNKLNMSPKEYRKIKLKTNCK